MAKKIDVDIAERPTTKTKFARDSREAERVFERKRKTRRVRPDRLSPNRHQEGGFPQDEGIEELADSIAQYGLLQYPAARKLPDGRLELIYGHRRTLAYALAATRGLVPPKMPVHIMEEVDDFDALQLMIIENHHQRGDARARRDYVRTAELMGKLWEQSRRRLGREPSLREMSAITPYSHDTVRSNLPIHHALQDPELEPLIRGVERRAPKNMLLTILRKSDRDSKIKALEGVAAGHERSEIEALIAEGNGQQSPLEEEVEHPKHVEWRNTDDGKMLCVLVSDCLSESEIDTALIELEQAKVELRRMKGGA